MLPICFAIGAFIQALEQNPGIEQLLQQLQTKAHVYVSTGIGCIDTLNANAITLYKAQRRWNRFWGSPENNVQLRHYLAGQLKNEALSCTVPQHPQQVPSCDQEAAEETWWHFWTEQSIELIEYLKQLSSI